MGRRWKWGWFREMRGGWMSEGMENENYIG